MTCDDAALLIDDHVDGACDPVTAAAVGHHLSTCESVPRAGRGPVADPRGRAHAGAGGAAGARVGRHPGDGCRLRPTEAPSAGWRQLLAAAAGFALIVSGLCVGRDASAPAAPAGVQLAEVQADDQFQQAEAAYQTAIDDLERIATEADAPALAEPAFVALHASLVDLDEAIGEARERLSVEPDDEFSQESLLTALDNKVVLLQDAVALLDQDRTDIEGSNP